MTGSRWHSSTISPPAIRRQVISQTAPSIFTASSPPSTVSIDHHLNPHPISPASTFKMRGLPVHSDSFCFPQRETTLFERIRQIFKGPPHRQPKPESQNHSEKKYHHTPTHSGSSFLKTTTTAAMRDAEEQRVLDEILGADSRVGHLPPAVDDRKKAEPPSSLI